jgi:hypothetical protein
MDEHHRAVGSNPTSSASPLNRLHALIQRFFTDELVSNVDSKTWKVSCFLPLLSFVETHVEVHLPRAGSFSWIHARLLCAIRPFSFFTTHTRAESMKEAVCQSTRHLTTLVIVSVARTNPLPFWFGLDRTVHSARSVCKALTISCSRLYGSPSDTL